MVERAKRTAVTSESVRLKPYDPTSRYGNPPGSRPCSAQYWTGCKARQHGRCCEDHRTLHVPLTDLVLFDAALHSELPPQMVYSDLFVIRAALQSSAFSRNGVSSPASLQRSRRLSAAATLLLATTGISPTDDWCHIHNLNIATAQSGVEGITLRYCSYCHRMNPYRSPKCVDNCYTQRSVRRRRQESRTIISELSSTAGSPLPTHSPTATAAHLAQIPVVVAAPNDSPPPTTCAVEVEPEFTAVAIVDSIKSRWSDSGCESLEASLTPWVSWPSSWATAADLCIEDED